MTAGEMTLADLERHVADLRQRWITRRQEAERMEGELIELEELLWIVRKDAQGGANV